MGCSLRRKGCLCWALPTGLLRSTEGRRAEIMDCSLSSRIQPCDLSHPAHPKSDTTQGEPGLLVDERQELKSCTSSRIMLILNFATKHLQCFFSFKRSHRLCSALETDIADSSALPNDFSDHTEKRRPLCDLGASKQSLRIDLTPVAVVAAWINPRWFKNCRGFLFERETKCQSLSSSTAWKQVPVLTR